MLFVRYFLLLCTISIAAAQDFPWYIESFYPSQLATETSTTTSIVIRQSAFYNSQYSLATLTGVKVPLNPYIFTPYVSLTPAAKLAPATTYMLSIIPGAGGDPFFLKFT